ncbi:MAG TPA: hypothetical protein VE570_16160 [Thermoleophilaceae bacterium]|jgi:hypothetical protein|nr:hypothetical protein [Thermoleophilaceae bacterium]
MDLRMSSPDDVLLKRLQAPPDLRDGIESLRYWRERSERLAWYRVRARREARVMSKRWEKRVRAALLARRGTPLGTRVSAALLLGRISLERINSRAVLVAAAAFVVGVALVPVVVTLFLLAQIF